MASLQAPSASSSLHNESVQRPSTTSLVVFDDAEEIPDGYSPFADVVSQGMVSDTAEVSVLRALRLEAQSIGADAVALTYNGLYPFREYRASPLPNQPPEWVTTQRYRIEATAYYLRRDSIP